MQWVWLFWATFGCIQKNICYLTDNFQKQGYKVLFFSLPHCNYVWGTYVTFQTFVISQVNFEIIFVRYYVTRGLQFPKTLKLLKKSLRNITFQTLGNFGNALPTMTPVTDVPLEKSQVPLIIKANGMCGFFARM